jgi:hypothetical protein
MGALTDELQHPRPGIATDVLGWSVAWLSFYLVAAGVLYLMALTSADRCLGRIR